MREYEVEVKVNMVNWFSLYAANEEEAAAKAKQAMEDILEYNIDYDADETEFMGGSDTITIGKVSVSNTKMFYVNVGVNCEDNIDYEWFSVKAANAIEAEDKVCEWLEENTNYANCCAIECVCENTPNLIVAID